MSALRVALLSTWVVVASVVLASRIPAVAVLEVHPQSTFEAPECGLGAPPTIFLAIDDTGVWLGEEFSVPRQYRDPLTLRTELMRLKEARQDREEAVIRVEDDVVLSAVVDVVDLLNGLNMRQLTVITGAEGAQFDREQWVRPDYRAPAPLTSVGRGPPEAD